MLKHKSESGDLNEILGSSHVYFEDDDPRVKNLSQVWYAHNNVRKLVWENSITLTLPDGMNGNVPDTTLYPISGFDVWGFIVANNPYDAKTIYINNPSGQKIGRVNFSIPAGYNVTFTNDGEIFGYPDTASLFLYAPIKIINNGTIYGGGGTGGTGGAGGATNASSVSGRQFFTRNGTFVVPAGVISVNLFMIGAGGKGSEMGKAPRDRAGGGFAGTSYVNSVYHVTPGASINVIVGSGDTYFGSTKAKKGRNGTNNNGGFQNYIGYSGNGGSASRNPWGGGYVGSDGLGDIRYESGAGYTRVSGPVGWGGQSSGLSNGGNGKRFGYASPGGVGSGGGGAVGIVGQRGGGAGGRGEVRVYWNGSVSSTAGGAGGAGGAGIGWGSPATSGASGAAGSWNANNTAKSGAGGKGGDGGSWGQKGTKGETGSTSSDGNSGTSGVTPTSVPYAVYQWRYAKSGSVLGNIVGGLYN